MFKRRKSMFSDEENIAFYICAVRKVVFFIDVQAILAQVKADLTDENKVTVWAPAVYTYC